MQDHSVLDIDAVPDADRIHVAAQHGSVPDAAVVAHPDVADYCGILCEEAVLSISGTDVLEFSYDRHGLE